MNGAPRIGFVGDGGAPEVLAGLLQPCGIQVVPEVAPQGLELGTLRRHRGYLRLACQALRLSRRVDGILIWQQYVALYYLLLAPFWPARRRVPLMLYYLIYKPMKQRLPDRWKFAAMQRLLRADDLRRVYFLSRSDRLFATVPRDKRRLLMHCPFRSAFIEGRGVAMTPQPFQVFSGGLSNRDYSAIEALARRMPEAGFRIVARPEARRELSAPNIDLAIDVYGDAFEQLICTSEAVVIPLRDPDVVSGQLVIMAALQAGTPVFVSRNSFVDDWLGAQRPEGSVIQYDSIDELAGLLRGLLGRSDAGRRARARQLYEQQQDEQLIYREFTNGWQEILAGLLPPQPQASAAGETTR